MPAPVRRGQRRIYDEAVREAVILISEASDRICGKRLKAAMPRLVESMEPHGHLDLDPDVRARMLSASAGHLGPAPEASESPDSRSEQTPAVISR